MDDERDLKMSEKKISALAVYCGSSSGFDPAYAQAARQLGTALAERGIELVYGGGAVGMMGEIATAALAVGGKVIGVIPRALAERGLAHPRVSELYIVESMHERKALMAQRADGFVALPGGLGTLEEISEALTWAQLDLHVKPCGLLNVKGFYDPLLAFLDHITAEGFLHAGHRSLVLVGSNPDDLLAQFEVFEQVKVDKAAWAMGSHLKS
jgi:uncharacterized protein (TIGR00730 family)